MAIKQAKELVRAAQERIEQLSVAQLQGEMAAADLVLFDLREQNERELHGVIPGAIHAPRGMLEFWADPSHPLHRPEFDPDRRIVLHCASGGRTALAADTLRQMGYPRVAHLEGGFKAWQKAGGEVVSADHSPEAPAH